MAAKERSIVVALLALVLTRTVRAIAATEEGGSADRRAEAAGRSIPTDAKLPPECGYEKKIGPPKSKVEPAELTKPDPDKTRPVVEAVAFGAPHATWGEEVAAAVVLREPHPEAAILAYCKERLADYKRPKKLYIVETIPRTATGKIQRGAVAKALAGAD